MKNIFSGKNTLINTENYTGADIILVPCNVCGYFEIDTKYINKIERKGINLTTLKYKMSCRVCGHRWYTHLLVRDTN